MPRPKSKARKARDAKSRQFVTPHDHNQLKWKIVSGLSRPTLETLVAGMLEQLVMMDSGPAAEHLFVANERYVRNSSDIVIELRSLLHNMQVLPLPIKALTYAASQSVVDATVIAVLQDLAQRRCRCRK